MCSDQHDIQVRSNYEHVAEHGMLPTSMGGGLALVASLSGSSKSEGGGGGSMLSAMVIQEEEGGILRQHV